MLRIDPFFKLTSFATKQEKLLTIIHNLTGGVIKKKKQEFAEKGELSLPEIYTTGKNIETTSAKIDSTVKDSKMRYVRDDLDEIDENDVGQLTTNFIIHITFFY